MIWILLIVFQIKHFIADYPLQNAYMLGKFKDKGWVLPLAAHCGVHWLFTTIIAFCVFFHAAKTTVTPDFQSTKLYIVLFVIASVFGLIDFIIHFIMDRIKASPNMLGKYQALSKTEMIKLLQLEALVKASELNSDRSHQCNKDEIAEKKKSNVLFWWSLGFDQMIHHLTDILIIALIMSMI